MKDDEALDTAVAFLKSLSDHAVANAPQETTALRRNASAWVRHLAVGGAHPEDPSCVERDFAGARRFVARTMRNGHAVQLRTESQLRDTAFSFASELHALVASEEETDVTLQRSVDALKDVSEHGSIEDLRRATSSVSRQLFNVVADRKRRRSQSVSRATTRLPELLDVLQSGGSLSVDAATGFLDQRGIMEAAERVFMLTRLASAPASVTVFQVQDEPVLEKVAPVISRAFLSRNDVLGRTGRSSIAVVSAGADLEAARGASERAKKLIQEASLRVGVAPLQVPLTASLDLAEAR